MSEAEPFDVIVLGAGISGLVAASVLAEQGVRRICVIDTYRHVDGNHIDVAIGPYTFDIGSLIFQDDSPLLRHFAELLPLYVAIDPTWSRLTSQGRITAYPVSVRDDILAAGAVEWMRIGLSLLWARSTQRRIHSAHDFARYWIGARFLKRSGLESYLKRFYGLPGQKIDAQFAQSRMLWIKEHASVATHIKRRFQPPSTAPGNRQLARPREGFTFSTRPPNASWSSGARSSSSGPKFPESISRANSRAERSPSGPPRSVCGPSG